MGQVWALRAVPAGPVDAWAERCGGLTEGVAPVVGRGRGGVGFALAAFLVAHEPLAALAEGLRLALLGLVAGSAVVDGQGCRRRDQRSGHPDPGTAGPGRARRGARLASAAGDTTMWPPVAGLGTRLHVARSSCRQAVRAGMSVP